MADLARFREAKKRLEAFDRAHEGDELGWLTGYLGAGATTKALLDLRDAAVKFVNLAPAPPRPLPHERGGTVTANKGAARAAQIRQEFVVVSSEPGWRGKTKRARVLETQRRLRVNPKQWPSERTVFLAVEDIP